MYKFLTKNGQTLAFGLGVLITVIFLGMVLANVGEFTALPEEEQEYTGIFNFGLIGAIVLAVFASAAMVFFGLFHVVADFKGSIKGILGFAVLLVVFLIAYSTASTEASPYIQGAIDNFEKGGAEFSGQNLKFISGGITTTLVLVAVAALAFVVSEVTNLFK
jgi:hypothetical protein